MSNRVKPEAAATPTMEEAPRIPSDRNPKQPKPAVASSATAAAAIQDTQERPLGPSSPSYYLKVKQDVAPVSEHIIVALLVLAVSYVFIVLFSGMTGGYGDRVFLLFASNFDWLYIVGGVTLVSGVTLFCSDAHQWHGKWKYVARMLGFVVLVGVIVTCLLFTKSFPAAPMGVYLLSMPSIFMIFKLMFYPKQTLPTYLKIMISSLAVMSIVVVSMWITWLVVWDRWWNNDVKIEFYGKVGCGNATESFNTSNNEVLVELVGCTPAFLLWLAPLVLSVWGFVFALVLHFLVRAYHQAQSEKGTITVDPLLQFFLSFIILGLLGVWAAAGIAGAEMGVSNVVLALSFLALIVSGAVVLSVFGWTYIRSQVTQQPLGHRMMASLDSDWARALILLLAAPVFVVYIILSVLTQFSRKAFPCTKRLDERDENLIVTRHVYDLVVLAKRWEWSSVLIKTMWWAVAFFLLMVGVGRAVTVFMSWLNGALATTDLEITTIVFFFVGLIMFLLPPVPGLPVYIAGGVILTNNARDEFTFWGAIAFTVVICFSLKLLAICMQQKLIGERMGTSIKVRQFVGINSIQIRAVKSILQEPGIKLEKVMILIGGPDWPTSVLTGILGLSLKSMILGSLPVFFLIAPTCVAGAMLLRTGDGSFWESIASIALALSFVVQSGALLAAAHFIEKRARDIADDPFDVDEEVQKLNEEVLVKSRLRNKLMSWDRLNIFVKFVVISGSLSMAASCYMFQLFGSKCFKSFKTTDTIEVELDGNPLNIILPMGIVALSLFAYGTLALIFINQYANHKVKSHTGQDITADEEAAILSKKIQPDEEPQFLTSWYEVICFRCCVSTS